jgi:ATP-dependent DNA ligase
MSKLKPMKASDVKDVEALQYPLEVLTKYDGVYALVHDGNLLGRSLKPFKNSYITELLSNTKFEGFVGELCETQESKTLAREDLCRNTTSCVNTIDKEWEFDWKLFDYIHPDVVHLGYSERIEALYKRIGYISSPLDISIVESTTATCGADVVDMYEESLSLGYEGIILRKPDGKWKNGRSTLKEQFLLRMKPQSDAEAVVVGVVEAMENNNVALINELGYTERSSHQENKAGKGMLGSFLCIDLVSGKDITVSAGKLTHGERVEYFNNPPIHQVVKYRSMTYGVKEAPRFARFYNFRAVEDLDEKLVAKYYEIIGGAK